MFSFFSKQPNEGAHFEEVLIGDAQEGCWGELIRRDGQQRDAQQRDPQERDAQQRCSGEMLEEFRRDASNAAKRFSMLRCRNTSKGCLEMLKFVFVRDIQSESDGYPLEM